MKHALKQMQYRLAVIYETLRIRNVHCPALSTARPEEGLKILILGIFQIILQKKTQRTLFRDHPLQKRCLLLLIAYLMVPDSIPAEVLSRYALASLRPDLQNEVIKSEILYQVGQLKLVTELLTRQIDLPILLHVSSVPVPLILRCIVALANAAAEIFK